MPRARPTVVGRLSFWVGLVALAIALVMFLSARFGGSGEGFRDLARFAGGLLFLAASGVAFGTSLIATAAAGERAPRWRLAVALAGAFLALLAALALLSVAVDAPNVGLVAFALAVAALSVGGLVAGAKAWTRSS